MYDEFVNKFEDLFYQNCKNFVILVRIIVVMYFTIQLIHHSLFMQKNIKNYIAMVSSFFRFLIFNLYRNVFVCMCDSVWWRCIIWFCVFIIQLLQYREVFQEKTSKTWQKEARYKIMFVVFNVFIIHNT